MCCDDLYISRMGIDFTPMNDDPSIFPLEVEIFKYEVKNTATVEADCT